MRDDYGSNNGAAECQSINYALTNINAQNGFNGVDQPLQPIPVYSGPGYGGGAGGPAGPPVLTGLPKPPKVKHVAKKPKHYATKDPRQCESSKVCL